MNVPPDPVPDKKLPPLVLRGGQFIQISAVATGDGISDTIYALDSHGRVWWYWTGDTHKTWGLLPNDREGL